MRNFFLVILLVVASALLLSSAWLPGYDFFSFLIFAGFIPLLFIEDFFSHPSHRHKKMLFFFSIYLSFLLWNFCTTWWIYEASLGGAVMAVVFNALFMSIVFYFFHFTKTIWGNAKGYIAFIFYWLAFEYLHLNWDLSWPWLTLGNGFANLPQWIQWYEYTGVLGGSLWVLVINVTVFVILKQVTVSLLQKKQLNSLLRQVSFRIIFLLLFIGLPILFSEYIYSHFKEDEKTVDVVVVQPNIDPYNEKFSSSSEEQLDKLLRLAASVTDSNTKYIVGPETAIPDGAWEHELNNEQHIQTIRNFIKKYPRLHFVAGIASYKEYGKEEQPSVTARRHSQTNVFYDAFNTAMQIDNSDSIQLYHKSKLVLGVEKIPFPAVFGLFEKFAINLGGTTGSLGIQKERGAFTEISITGNKNTAPVVAPVICYESVYGEFVSGYIQKGATLIFIITNDGWWGDTPGYKQHLSYARLRAIEMRRDIARSANTGISCFINQRGDIIQKTNWWEPAVIKTSLSPSSKITFYAQYGDYTGRIATFIASVLLLITFVNKKIRNL